MKQLLLAGVLGALLVPAHVGAARFSFAGPDAVAPGSDVVLTVLLDTEGEELNAVEGDIVVDHAALRVVGVETGDSAVVFWIEPPTLTDRGVRFSGATPGGVAGRDLALFRIIFEGGSLGEGTLSFANLKALENDGAGTLANVDAVSPYTVRVSADAPPSRYDAGDIIPPEAFTVSVEQSADMFGGNYVAFFAAHDKGTGISYYEVAEGHDPDADNLAWIQAESPYVLNDQSRSSYVFVKAVDQAGNNRISVVPPEQTPYTPPWWFVLVALLFVGWFFLQRYRRRH